MIKATNERQKETASKRGNRCRLPGVSLCFRQILAVILAVAVSFTSAIPVSAASAFDAQEPDEAAIPQAKVAVKNALQSALWSVEAATDKNGSVGAVTVKNLQSMQEDVTVHVAFYNDSGTTIDSKSRDVQIAKGESDALVFESEYLKTAGTDANIFRAWVCEKGKENQILAETDVLAVTDAPLAAQEPETFCNPVNLSYSLQYGLRGTGGFRMLADPQPIYYNGEYWLFPTHASGYYHSTDLVNWEFVYSSAEQINNYAPGTFVHNGWLYISRHSSGNLYRTKTPEKGNSWEYVRKTSFGDPYYFKDPDTGRIFALHGCLGINDSNKNSSPINILELDTSSPTLEPLPVDTSVPGASSTAGYPVFYMDREEHGYEVPGQYNDNYSADKKSWLEGSGMLKHDGKYYIYYSGPATESASYADGCYVSDDPLGPYEWCDSSPFAYKATGYTVGAAHGHDIVVNETGTLWKFGSVSIASNDIWERRLNLYPVEFDKYGRPITDLSVADYPMYVPTSEKSMFTSQGPEWNLLSYGITTKASSTYDAVVSPKSSPEDEFRIAEKNAFDENIRTWWSAQTGNVGEWIQGDLGKVCTVNAVQLNFADQDAAANSSRPSDMQFSNVREYEGCYRYLIEYSLDGEHWNTLADKSDASAEAFKGEDYSHDYYEMVTGIAMRYVRVTNKGQVPAHGKFAISGLRLFGNGNGMVPSKVDNVSLSRIDGADCRSVSVSWDPAEGAQGYIIRYGTREDSLNMHYQVIGQTSARINNLTAGKNYFFRVDAYNDSGRTTGDSVKKIYGSYGADIEYDLVEIVTEKEQIPSLPKTVSAQTAAGKKDFKVIWEDINADNLEKEGTFQVVGYVDWTGDTVWAKISVSEPIGVEHVTAGTLKGKKPNLPKQVEVYFRNGQSGSRPVIWNLDGVSFDQTGIVEVTGSVGSLTVKASVRVSDQPGVSQGDTPVGKNLALNEDGASKSKEWPRTLAYYSNSGDIAHNATDGLKSFTSGYGKKIWSDYQKGQYHTNAGAAVGAADHLPFIVTAFGTEGSTDNNAQKKYAVDQVSLGFIEEDGTGTNKIRLPEDYKIEYYSADNGVIPANRLENNSAENCSNTKGWAADNPIKAHTGWTEVTYIDKPGVPDVADFKHMVDVKFEKVETTAIRVTLIPQKENWTGLEELEVYYFGEAELYGDFEVKDIQIGTESVLDQFDANGVLDWPGEMEKITASATNNASVSIIEGIDGYAAKIIFLPENGDVSKRREFTVNFTESQKEPDKAAAENVKALIGAIGTVSYTPECKAKIDAARDAYDALTETQKALVTEDSVTALKAAEGRYEELKKAAESQQPDPGAEDQKPADNVKRLIEAIGTVSYTAESKAKIDAARNAYNALDESQKKLVAKDSVSVLAAAEAQYAQLEKDAKAKTEKEKAQKGTQSVEELQKSITKTNTDKADVKGSVFAAFRLKAKEGNKSIKLSWNKIKGANGYLVYGAPCGKKLKLVKDISSSKKSYTVQKLKKGKYYKYMVAAYKKIYGEKRIIVSSVSVHSCVKGGKTANPKYISCKAKVNVKKGKTSKLKPAIKPGKNVKTHIAKFRYESTNTKIATVSKKGKIKGVKKGSCYVYVYTQNGLYKRVKVIVK